MRFANGICHKSPSGWFAVQYPSGNLHRKRFGSSLRAADFAMETFHVDSWNTLKDEGFRIVPSDAPTDFSDPTSPEPR